MDKVYRGFTITEDKKGNFIEGHKEHLAIKLEDGLYAAYNNGKRRKIQYTTLDMAINAITAELDPNAEQNAIRVARENAGLSREEVERLIGLPHITLCSWENNKRKCPEWAERLIIAEIERISDAKKKLGV